MEQKVPNKSTMVSRLPKFGARCVNRTHSPVHNGTTQTGPIQEDTNISKPHGVTQVPPLSIKWKKDPCGPLDEPEQCNSSDENKVIPSQQSPKNRELKSPSTSASKARRSASATESPKPLLKSAKSLQSPKPRPKSTPISSKGQSVSNKSLHFKPNQNGLSTPGQTSSSGLQQPRTYSTSTQSTSRDSLSQSSDSLTRQAHVSEYMVRSQSFTHFKQLPSPSNTPMPRSFSFNKAVELAKPLANTQLRPPRTLRNKSNLSLSKGHLGLNLGGMGFGKCPTDRTSPPTPSESSTPPSYTKKALLLNSTTSAKPSFQSYRLNRPIAAKQQCPLVLGRTSAENDVVTPPLTPESPRGPLKSALPHTDFLEEFLEDHGADANLQMPAEVTEDMSFSSASSLERNDTSEEFLDDFTNLTDQSQNGIRSNNNPASTPSLQSFLNETMDWTGIALAGGKTELRNGPLRGPSLMSPDIDHLAPSSLELSPSNSSGGTYMWDEEGMEPLGHNSHLLLCSSYESDLNSVDILNNLENTGSCDLEDDDLMLDADLPEEGALRNDGMANSDRVGRPAQWRRRQQRWSGSDHSQYDNRLAGFQMFHCPTFQYDSHTVPLDELTLKHMSEDCSSVKAQLMKLKNLLQMDDGEVTPESLETSEDVSGAQQMEELMKEVAHLREELKNKDKIIVRLTHQQHQETPVRCHCHQQKPGVKGERRTYHDKSTQTPWRPPHHQHAPQILQSISHSLSEPFIQGKLARSVPTEVLSDASPPLPCADAINSHSENCTEVPQNESRSLPDQEELSQLLSSRLCVGDGGERKTAVTEGRITRPTPDNPQRNLSLKPRPGFLQPPRFPKRITPPNPAHPQPSRPSRGSPWNNTMTRGRLYQLWPSVVGRDAELKPRAKAKRSSEHHLQAQALL